LYRGTLASGGGIKKKIKNKGGEEKKEKKKDYQHVTKKARKSFPEV